MPLALSLLTSGSDTTNNPATTASISPSSGGVVYAFVAVAWAGGPEADTATISGCGLTWTRIGDQYYASRRRFMVFRGTGTPSSGSLTITADADVNAFAECAWAIIQVTGQGVTPEGTLYTNGHDSSGFTTLPVTVSETPDAGDMVLYAVALETSQSVTMDSELDTSLVSVTGGTDVRALHVLYDSSPDSTPVPDTSWSTDCGARAFAFIVKAAAASSPTGSAAAAAGAHASASGAKGAIGSAQARAGASAQALGDGGNATGTSYFDDFNRANGGIGSGYTNAIGAGLLIESNEARGYINEERGSLRTGEEYPADQFVEFTIGDWTAGGWVGAMLRHSGADATRNGYMLDAGQNQTYYLSKYVNGSGTNFIEGTGVPWAAGDVFRAEVEGYTLRLYRNGSLVDSYTDTGETFASGAPGLYTYSARGIDDATFGSLGAAAQFSRPISDISVGSWAASSGSDRFAMVDEASASDADYIWTATPGASVTLSLSDVIDPASSAGHIVRYRARRGSNNCSIKAELLQSSTVIAEWTDALSEAFATFSHTLTSGEADSLSPTTGYYCNLRLRLTAL